MPIMSLLMVRKPRPLGQATPTHQAPPTKLHPPSSAHLCCVGSLLAGGRGGATGKGVALLRWCPQGATPLCMKLRPFLSPAPPPPPFASLLQ